MNHKKKLNYRFINAQTGNTVAFECVEQDAPDLKELLEKKKTELACKSKLPITDVYYTKDRTQAVVEHMEK